MTVMDAEDTGDLQIVIPGTPKVDAIVRELFPHVKALTSTGHLPAAVILLNARAAEFDTAWREEMAGIQPPPAPTMTERQGCVSMDHADLDCPTALREGRLPDGATFCPSCQQSTIVHIVTTAAERPEQARAS